MAGSGEVEEFLGTPPRIGQGTAERGVRPPFQRRVVQQPDQRWLVQHDLLDQLRPPGRELEDGDGAAAGAEERGRLADVSRQCGQVVGQHLRCRLGRPGLGDARVDSARVVRHHRVFVGELLGQRGETGPADGCPDQVQQRPGAPNRVGDVAVRPGEELRPAVGPTVVAGDLPADDVQRGVQPVALLEHRAQVSPEQGEPLGPSGTVRRQAGELGDLGERHAGRPQVHQHLDQLDVGRRVDPAPTGIAGWCGQDSLAFVVAQRVGIEAETLGHRRDSPGPGFVGHAVHRACWTGVQVNKRASRQATSSAGERVTRPVRPPRPSPTAATAASGRT